jgi:hypothetical protein
MLIAPADVMTDFTSPQKKTKAELEQLIKSNGGHIFQKHDAVPNITCIGGRSKCKTWGKCRSYLLTVNRSRQSCFSDETR